MLASLAAGAVDAIAGGGGLLTVPALLAVGLPPELALGTNKGQAVFGSGAALRRFARSGLVDGRMSRVTFPAGFAGSLAGAALLLLVPSRVLRPVVLVLLVVVAVVLAVRPASPTPHAGRAARERPLRVAAAISAVIGAYDGFFGPGTGTFLIFGFVVLLGHGMRDASADAKVVNFASNLAAVLLLASRGLVVWSVALPMAAGQFAGATLGAHLAIRGGDRVVRRVVLAVVTVLVLKLGADLLRGA